MQPLTSLIRRYMFTACLIVLPFGQSMAGGEIGHHVNALNEHLEQYDEEVRWMLSKIDIMVETYESKGKEAANSDALIEYWEEVDFHSAIETTYVPIYASIWQGLFGVKTAIDKEASIDVVRDENAKLQKALWQGLGVVKLAARYQEKGLVGIIETTESEPTTTAETLDDIKDKLDKVVAKYAENLTDAAKSIVFDTYLHRFEGIEGMLIEQDADLVEELEKDFNVTLPKAVESTGQVDEVRSVVEMMQVKLDKAKALLVKAEEERKDVF